MGYELPMSHIRETLLFSAALLGLMPQFAMLLWIVFTLALTAVFAKVFRYGCLLSIGAGAGAAVMMTYICMLALVLFGKPHT